MTVPNHVRVLLVGLFCVGIGAMLGPTMIDAAPSTKDVLVINTEAEAVPVAVVGAPAPQVTAISKRLQFAFDSDSFTSFSQVEYEVPEGKLLEIKFLTMHDINRVVAFNEYEVVVTHNGEDVSHKIASSSQADDGDVITEQTTIFADPGSTVSFIVHVTPALDVPPGGTDFMYGSFVGTLTDV